MHPQLFEETVASVFRDLGYQAVATAYSGDDGIDVVLQGPEGDTIGVQVKRYKESRRIGVDQIRELAGSLVLQGWTTGIFVTTSDFQSGAHSTVDRLERFRGMRIELVNATRFYDQLQLAQRNRYQSVNDADAPYTMATLNLIRKDTYRFTPPDVV
jgi:restriction system protein